MASSLSLVKTFIPVPSQEETGVPKEKWLYLCRGVLLREAESRLGCSGVPEAQSPAQARCAWLRTRISLQRDGLGDILPLPLFTELWCPVAESAGHPVLGMVAARDCRGGWIQGCRICLSVCLFCSAAGASGAFTIYGRQALSPATAQPLWLFRCFYPC